MTDDGPKAPQMSRQVENRHALRKLAASASLRQSRAKPGWAEFGVRKGKSAKALLELLPADGSLHLFDSWQGLPENWVRRGSDSAGVPKGHFACPQPDLGDDRCMYWPGWFEETAPAYLSGVGAPISLAHLDCDLYSSTATVLEVLGTSFAQGSVLIFDDLFGYPKWQNHQWLAWSRWIGGRTHLWIGHTEKGQAAVRLGAP